MKLGIGSAIVSPKVWDKISMGGMGRREKTRGVLTDLVVQALVLQEGSKSTVICVMDQLFTMLPEAAELEKRCRARLPDANFIPVATHVHSSEAIPYMGERDNPIAKQNCAAALQLVFEGFGEALDIALKDLREVEIAAGRFDVSVRLGANRRAKLSNGTCITAWDDGAMLPPGLKYVGRSSEDATWVDLMAFREPGKSEPLVVLSSYPSHVHFYEVPYFADEFAGSVRRAVMKRHPGLTMVYTLGCCGNISLGSAHPILGNAEETRIAWYKEKSKEFSEKFADIIDASLRKMKYEPAGEMKYTKFHEAPGEREKSVTIETLRLGKHAICAIPGEIFIEFDADLRRDTPAESMLVMTYNNSFVGYVATALGFEEGAYEVMRGTAKETGYLEPIERVKSDLDTGDYIVGIARKQVAELFAK